MAKPLVLNATLVNRSLVTDDLMIAKVRTDADVAPLWFVPGQYCVLGLNNDAKPELGSVRRSMSIASDARVGDTAEFYIRRVARPESENPFTHLLWNLPECGRIYMGPKAAGHFTLPDCLGPDDRRKKILVAAGTGLAPFVSMARSMPERRAELAILHGASYEADLGYREELTSYAHEGLAYVPSLSRPHTSWKGANGRVEDLFRRESLPALEASLGLGVNELHPRNAVVFICGLQGTIGSTLIRLLARGFVPDHRRIREALGVDPAITPSLFFEQYDTEPVVDLKDESNVASMRQTLQEALRGGFGNQ